MDKSRLLFFLMTLCIWSNLSGNDLKLFYNRPATDWMNEALPIGNGYMGAMLFGGVDEDEIQISEESIWAGGPGSGTPYQYGNKSNSWEKLAELRQLLRDHKIKDAEEMAQKYFTGQINSCGASGEFGDYGAHQPFGSLFVAPQLQDSTYTNYERELDIEQSIAKTTFQQGNICFKNEYFASYPARLIIVKYQNDSPQGVDYRIRFETPHLLLKQKLHKNKLRIEGRHQSNGLIISGEIYFKTDGKLTRDDSGYLIKGARQIEAYVSVATDYQNQYPHYRGGDYKKKHQLAINKASSTSYDKLKQEHITDYTTLFKRVQFQLEGAKASTLPTDTRLYRYSCGAYDPSFESLYFQYGRYLLISSSRPGTLPAHLQGKWNNLMTPPWACDYHMNINLQMIYWPAEVTNLSDCHQPLLKYIDSLREPGRETARNYFNCRGWSVHTMNNAYGFTAPGWDFNWGYAPNSAAWLCDHLWKHYAFTADTVYLKDFAYPIMKEVGCFWLDYLSEDTDGTLVSSPSFSPEHGQIGIGATIDQQIAYDLFTNLLQAGDILSDHSLFRDSIADARKNLSPLKIGRFGQLQEWKEDLDDPSNRHRHVSHLYAVFPGKQITSYATPELAEAAQRSLVYRGEEGTGWSLGWKINLWARFQDGEQSYKMIRNLLTPSLGKGCRPSGAGSYSNLLCAHPPFQIDGNLGAVSGMAEMLLQSHNDFIEILPALPSAWPSGRISGLKAQGNFTVDMIWKDGLIEQVMIESPNPGSCKIAYKGRIVTLSFSQPGIQTLTQKQLFD